MINSAEVKDMCPVHQGVHHGAAPIPKEEKWVKPQQMPVFSGVQRSLAVLLFVMMFTFFFSVEPVLAGDMPVPSNATDVTEESFTDGVLYIDTAGYYRFVPENDVMIRVYNTRSPVYLENDGECVIIEVEHFNNGYDLYHLKKGNTYYFYSPKYKNIELVSDFVKVVFHLNGGMYGQSDKEKYEMYLEKGTATGATNTNPGFRLNDTYNFVRDGYVLYGWNTKADRTGNYIYQYESIMKDMDFYAIWSKKVVLTLDANGGYFASWNEVDPETDKPYTTKIAHYYNYEAFPGGGAKYDSMQPADNISYHYYPTREGFIFRCWNSEADGSGKSYSNNDLMDCTGNDYIKDNITVYAVWTCADDHVFGAWRTTIPATEIANGVQTHVCSRCGEKETQEIAQLAPTLKAVTISKPEAAKKSATIKWKKVSKKNLKKIKKIEIQYSTDKNFRKNVKSKYVSAKKTSYKITKLKSKKKYYVRIRAYTESGGQVHVSKWSAKKPFKVK